MIGSLFSRAWIWAFVAAGITFVFTAAIGQSQSGFGLLVAALTFSAFSVIVGLGQMFVITLGPGNVDLSIPATMTLAGTVSLKLMGGDAGVDMAMLGLLVALGIGLASGIANYALIRLLRIPPIIATLASAFVYQSIAIWSNRGIRIKPPEALADFAIGRSLGIPNVALVALTIAVFAWVALNLSAYGRNLSATGQNPRAARLAGVPTDAVTALTYILCACLASLTGFLLSCFSGGAALNMGTEYLLTSIAVVVIGGSSIGGGRSNVPGIWGGALFLFLIVSMLNSYGLGAGVRLLLTGLIIIAIVAVGSRPVKA